MEKVLIAGASGLLGAHVTNHLKNNYQVITHAHSKAGFDVYCDFTNRDETLKRLDQIKPEIIVNLVALTNVDCCEEDPQLAYKLNIHSAENIAAWTNQNNDTHIISISTDHVYDNEGFNSEDNVNLRNYYAFSKYGAELALLNVGTTILRTNFFGKSQRCGKMSFSDWLFYSFRNKLPLHLFQDVYFSPLLMNTLVEMIELVIQKQTPGIFNLGSNTGLSKKDFSLLMAKTLGFTDLNYKVINSEESKLKAKRPKQMMMNSYKFEKEFDIELPTLEEEIEKLRSIYEAQ